MTARPLIPGYTYTGMAGRGPEKPEAAWSAEQVVDYIRAGMEADDLYRRDSRFFIHLELGFKRN